MDCAAFCWNSVASDDYEMSARTSASSYMATEKIIIKLNYKWAKHTLTLVRPLQFNALLEMQSATKASKI